MITNSSLTIYHYSGLDENKNELWTRYNYDKVWFFGGKGAGLYKGYENANNVEIRIPYDMNNNLNINNFKIGDIIVQGSLNLDITSQNELKDYLIYKLESINNNNFGNNQHIHLGGK